MRRRLLFVLAIAVGFLFGWLACADAQVPGRPIEPSDAIQNSISNPVLSWFVQQWKEEGFEMPEEGKPFKWSDFLASVPDNKGQCGDLVRYMDNGTPKVAIVIDPAGSGGPQDTRLAVEYPISEGMHVIAGVDQKDVVGYLRPHKAQIHVVPRDGEI